MRRSGVDGCRRWRSERNVRLHRFRSNCLVFLPLNLPDHLLRKPREPPFVLLFLPLDHPLYPLPLQPLEVPLQHMHNHVQRARLDDPRPNRLAPPYANVDDTLKRKRVRIDEVASLLRRREEERLRDRVGVPEEGVAARSEKEGAIDVGVFEVSEVVERGEEVVFGERLEGVFPNLTREGRTSTFQVGEGFGRMRGGGGGAERGRGGGGAVLENADEAFETAVAGEDFSDSRRSGGEVREVVEGVYEGEGGGRCVQSCVRDRGGQSCELSRREGCISSQFPNCLSSRSAVTGVLRPCLSVQRTGRGTEGEREEGEGGGERGCVPLRSYSPDEMEMAALP